MTDNASTECVLQLIEKILYLTVMPCLNLQDKGFLLCFIKWEVNFTTAVLEGQSSTSAAGNGLHLEAEFDRVHCKHRRLAEALQFNLLLCRIDTEFGSHSFALYPIGHWKLPSGEAPQPPQVICLLNYPRTDFFCFYLQFMATVSCYLAGHLHKKPSSTFMATSS